MRESTSLSGLFQRGTFVMTSAPLPTTSNCQKEIGTNLLVHLLETHTPSRMARRTVAVSYFSVLYNDPM